MDKIFIPIIFLQTLFGVGVVDGNETPPSTPREVVWLNWSSDGCQDEWFWPMIYSVQQELPANCQNRPMLLLNEPEVPEQSNATPQEAAAKLATLPTGMKVYCCGNLYDTGQWWWNSFVSEMNGDLSTLEGINIHIYSRADHTPIVKQADLEFWNNQSKIHNIPLVVSEWSYWPIPGTGYESASLKVLHEEITKHISPSAMFYFAYYMPSDWHHNKPNLVWSTLRMVDDSNQFTLFGDELWNNVFPRYMGQ